MEICVKKAVRIWWNSLTKSQQEFALFSLLDEAQEAEIVNLFSVDDAKEYRDDLGEDGPLSAYCAPRWFHTGEPIHAADEPEEFDE